MSINYIVGDATYPLGKGTKIIAHVCNDIGAWGAGFVMAISKRWKTPKSEYRKLSSMELGTVQLVKVEEDIYVANMIAQVGIYTKDKKIPLRYEALRECLNELATQALMLDASIHMPRIGCGLAGGKWEKVEQLIESELHSVEVFVYDFKGN